jgi:hypothetical protein
LPAVIAVKAWPNSSKDTTLTDPGGPLGDSLEGW